MTHPDPKYRKIGELPNYWMQLVLGKVLLFSGSFALFVLLGYLQQNGAIDTLGTGALVALAVAGFVGLFTWDFWPSKYCPTCHAKMHRKRIRPANPSPPSEKSMILCCDKCKFYIDLKVSTD